MTAVSEELSALFGGMDIYLLDQLMKGRFDAFTRVLDAGCGSGRNLKFFLRRGYEAYGIDQRAEAVEQVRHMVAEVAPGTPAANFQVAEVDRLPFPEGHFDAVISSAVLHFAASEAHFNRMVDEMWRVLRPGGLFFARLASRVGIEQHVRPLTGHRYLLPDGTERFLVDEAMLTAATKRLEGSWLEPLKTTNVHHQRCMSTWVLRKS